MVTKTITETVRDAYINCETRTFVFTVVAREVGTTTAIAKKICTSFLHGRTENELKQVKDTGLLIGQDK